MERTPFARFCRRWQFAFILSLILHGSALWLCSSVRLSGNLNRAPHGAGIDTRVPGSAMEVTLTIIEKKARSLSSQALPIPPAQPVTPAPDQIAKSTARSSTLSSFPVRTRSQGMTEEEGEAADSGLAADGIGSPGNKAGSGTTSFFQIATQARSVVYVIDRSASMGLNGSFSVAKRELLASLERLPAGSLFQVVVYNRSAEPLPLDGANLTEATPEVKRRVADLLENLRAEGGTDHVTALRRALAMQPEAIFFLTDADDLKLGQIQAITKLNHGRTIIHTIELSTRRRAHDDSALQALARANQGVYLFVPLER